MLTELTFITKLTFITFITRLTFITFITRPIKLIFTMKLAIVGWVRPCRNPSEFVKLNQRRCVTLLLTAPYKF